MNVTSKSVKETSKIGAELAKKIHTRKHGQVAMVIALEGELGAGKTIFAKAFAKALGIKSHITSPTFVIMKPYAFKGGRLYHIDAYRLKNHRDLEAIGIKEIIEDSNNIVLIEWSDRVKEILPKTHIKIHIDHIDESTREIRIS